MAIADMLQSAPAEVTATLERVPDSARAHLAELRTLILETAASLPEVGPVVEALKWGQPSFLTERSKSGTTIRLGWTEDGATVSLFVHCQTTLVREWRERYGDELTFNGNREIVLSTDAELPRAALQHCAAMALTYHSRKGS